MILFSVFTTWMEVTRGPLGIPGIPQPVILGWHVDTPWEFWFWRPRSPHSRTRSVEDTSSPFGRVLHAIVRMSFAKAHGRNT